MSSPRPRDSADGFVIVVDVRTPVLRYGREPKFRPRTRARLRARRVVAARTGTPLAELLGRADPLEAADPGKGG
ncbi:hypothetical protein ACH4A8_08250 [Streptomyces vietnamensis]|uniref:hypothetical protein n=1 Tax=Streptomyces vietnamensis TaxID=362257 RepID=UPI0037B0AD73